MNRNRIKAVLHLCSTALLLAAVDCFSEDITTLDGKTYKDARVTGVEADGVHITFRQGVVKLPFDELPAEIQQQYKRESAKPVEAPIGSAENGAGALKQVGDTTSFPQFPISSPVAIGLLACFVVVLKVAADSWVTNRKREQRRTFYRDEYLKSVDWKRKRAVVLQRDRYRCVYCGVRASQVHHKRYAPRNIGREPIEWLVSVCEGCHRKQHKL